jgi:hypothetical protein
MDNTKIKQLRHTGLRCSTTKASINVNSPAKIEASR